MAFLGLGVPEVLLILAIVLIMFGAKKLPELAKGLGKGIKEFKKASSDMHEDFNRGYDDEDQHRSPRREQERVETEKPVSSEGETVTVESSSKSDTSKS